MLLTLDSSSVQNQKSNDFTISYISPLPIKDGKHEIALIKANLWYSFFNVSVSLNNNVIAYTNTDDETKVVTFPDGNYTIIQLNDYLHGVMTANGDVNGNSWDINIEPDYSTIKVKISLSNSYEIDLTRSDFNLLLGWNKAIYSFNGSQEGSQPANINRDINSLIIHCDIIDQSYQNDISSDILYSFVPDVPPGSNIQVQPKPSLIYLPIKMRDLIYKIRMFITDQLNRPIDLNGQPVTYMLHIRKQSNIAPSIIIFNYLVNIYNGVA